MKRSQLFGISVLLFLSTFLLTTEASSFCRKKKKRKTNTTEASKPIDSVRVVREPGVMDPVSLDSIKAVKNKQKLNNKDHK